ncbi:hypothetical protein HG536_0B07120 [Torulaspora globosa]|uniref:Uncharacterized protein n=1 Tax=Torulaspora globosa TaxID=48254 RepID=A0A7G3ZEA8_9SACH|nr:uncharacterized protein HG536_0B07120 [Torulaspora globosa]QLL31844.1 hypothetical protein HG536_0B07120 [Torulaspora globosa]
MQVIATLPRTFLVTSYHAGHCHITPDIPRDVLSCRVHGNINPDIPPDAIACRSLPHYPRTFLVTSYHAGHCHITPDIPHDVLSCTTMATYPEHSSRRHIMQKFGMLPPDFPYHAGSCRTLPYRSLSAVIALGVFALRRYRNPPRISLPTEYCPCYPPIRVLR